MATITVFTLPQHLREVIDAFVKAEAGPESLRVELQAALDAPEVEEEDDEPPAIADVEGDIDAEQVEKQPRLRPPIIDGEVLDSLASWSASHVDELRAAGLDPLAYGHISLLAGTEVYLSPKARRLAKSAESENSPYLPASMSPHPPSFGSEYRGMMRDLATAFNVLFSVFGAGGAVYVAASTGAGWTREQSLLLGIFAGIVVAIADVGLILIFKGRLTTRRAEQAKTRVIMSKGSGAVKEESEGPVAVIEDKKEVRLRRRAIGT